MIIRKKKLTYCEDCNHPIFSRGAYLLSFFDEICDHFAQKETPYPLNDIEKGSGKNEMVQYLERDEFVITTEISEAFIAIKPTNCHKSKKHGCLFCFQPEEHFPDFVEDNDCEC